MAQRVAYQDRYSWGMQSSIDTAVNCSAGILFNNHPVFSAGQNIILTRKATGIASKNADRTYEFAQGTRKPITNGDITVSAGSIYMPLRTLFQKGSLQLSDTGSTSTKWFYPYTVEDSLCESWASLVREVATTGDTKSHRLVGTICDNMSIYVSEQYITASCSFIAREFEDDRDTTNDSFILPTDAYFIWTNATVKVGNGYTAVEDLDLFSFSLSINNGAVPKFYNNQLAKKFILGSIVGNGTLIVPRSNSSSNFTDNKFIDNFINGDVTRFSIYWGSQYATSTNSLSINFLARCNGADTDGDDELATNLSIELVEYSFISSNNSRITAWAVDANNDKKVSFTLSSGTTLTGNVFPGDYVQFTDATNGKNTFYTIEEVVDSSTIKMTTSHADGVGASGSSAVITCQPINIGLNDGVNRNIT